MVMALETTLSTVIMATMGDPAIAGIVMLAIFTIILFVMQTRLDGKVAILGPISFLVLPLIPLWGVVIALGFGGLFFLAGMKFWNK